MGDTDTRPLIRTISAGIAIGVVEVMLAASIAGLLFAEVGGDALSRGVGFAAFGAAVAMAFIGWRAGTSSVLGGLQATIAAVVAGAVVAGVADADPDQAVATAFVIVALSSLL
ncbi:MAG: hypothetical protein HKO87_00980, partial [Acidimicrobiia bacterium]|nr:hypothetical protein [Acidimicrobiia bacterium]